MPVSPTTSAQMPVHSEKLDRADLRQVAKLHQKALPKAFLSSLGDELLMAFYDGVQRYPGGHLLTVRAQEPSENQPAGENPIVALVTGVDDVTAFHRWLVRKHLPKAAWKFLPGLAKRSFSPRVLRKLKELLFYPRRAKQAHTDLPQAELLSLAVDESVRRKGLARALYSQLIQAFTDHKVPSFRILVGAELAGARAFYENQGATLATLFPLHAGGETAVYVQTVFGSFSRSSFEPQK